MSGEGLVLKNLITSDMVSGVLDEMVGLLPILVPASIVFIGLRKGIGFLFSTLKRA